MRRVLIANRGEIAIRIARAAQSLGVETVGVYARADEQALHRTVMDVAVPLPGDDAVAAYLDVDAVLDIAEAQQCDGIHPGYGFLSENADLAKGATSRGIKFIGPSAEAIALFGDKVAARALAGSCDVPVVPGSSQAVTSASEALATAEDVGFPVMLKASAGGGGRGMRQVNDAADMAEAFERCAGEARAAFGDDALFVEKCIVRPRHIEVQVFADQHGNVAHLYERDCSVQLRHQKVLEVAPAANLRQDLRQALHEAAVRLVAAAGYEGAATVEFLVDDAGGYYYIETNPRIQVEHTITEQVLGLDLVEAQFAIAGGANLRDMGWLDLPAPSRCAVQARVVIQGGGTITAYQEPSGAGVRVDGCGYAGLSPPTQYDPLLAKVICTAGSLDAALNRSIGALQRYLIDGVPTNLGALAAIADHPSVRAGDARTSLFEDAPELLGAALADHATRTLLRGRVQQRAAAGVPFDLPSVDVTEGAEAVECPMAGSIVRLNVSAGDDVAAGDVLFVVSAMKMEASVTAPVSGAVTALAAIAEGSEVQAGQVVVAITPADGAARAAVPRDQSWQTVLDEVAQLQGLAHARLAEGSEDPGVVRQRQRGKLTCRERIDLLLDEGSFQEVGSLAGFASYDESGAVAAFTPANHVGGWGTVEGRQTVVCADDFTSRGGHADGAIGAKSTYLDRLALGLRVPSVRLLDGSSGGGSVAAMVPEQKKAGESRAKESSGAIKSGRPRVAGGGGSFLPGHLGSSMYAEQLATIPVANVLLGSVVGIGAAKAMLGHFSVMVRDIAQLFVAGPPVVSHAMGYDITKEALGDWRIHCTNGSVDNFADSEEEAMALTRRFLSYLPASTFETPPVLPPRSDDPPERREEALLDLIPRQRTATFDVRRAIRLMADRDSFFEIGPLWGTDQVTGFARFNGHPVGILASDSRHENGGALTAAGCDKLTRHIDLCDLFHLPVINLVDNPGFAVGVEHETASTIRWGGRWMIAFAQMRTPMFTVLMRRSFGVAGNNYATPASRPSVRVTWPAADTGGIPPEGGIEAAYKRQLAEAEDPAALRAELYARIESARGPVGPLNRFQIEEMVDPRDTRRLICEWLPNAYRVSAQSDRLGPRPQGFRP